MEGRALKIKELREVLGVAARHCRNDGRPEAADALLAFATNLLAGDGDSTVSALVKQIERARKIPHKVAGQSRKRQRRA